METLSFLAKKILISKSNIGTFVPYSQIMYIHCDRPYVLLKEVDKKSFTHVYATISFFAKNLPDVFFCCNRSTIINLHYLSKYELENRHLVVKMADEVRFHVSQEKRKLFFNHIQNLKDYDTECLYCLNNKNRPDDELF